MGDDQAYSSTYMSFFILTHSPTSRAATVASHASGYHSFNFKSLNASANTADWDVSAPWELPQGFSQSVVSDETGLNIYPDGRANWHDMNVVNETGSQAGRFMYRTHEVRLGGGDSLVDAIGGSVSVLTCTQVKPAYWRSWLVKRVTRHWMAFAGSHGAPCYLPKKLRVAVYSRWC